MSAATMMSPPSGPPRSKAIAGQDDPGRYKILKRVAILDAHEPISKKVFDPAAVSRMNPSGLVDRTLRATPRDLEVLARHANSAVAKGRPPTLQIGHTPFDVDAPESSYPKPVGKTVNYSVGELDGVPCLFCDLYCLEEHAAEALTYPNLSVERVNFDDENTHAIEAVALLRRQPERELPRVAFAKGKVPRVCYSKEHPVFEADEPLPGELVAYAAEIGCFVPSLVRRRLLQDRTGFRANYARKLAVRVAYAAETSATRRWSDWTRALVNFASSRGISVPSEARRLFAEARARGEV